MERGGGFNIIMPNLAFSVLAFMALIVGGWPSVWTLWAVAAYFTISTSLLVLAQTGGLRDVLLAGIEHSAYIIKLIILITLYRRKGSDEASFIDHEIIEKAPSIISTDYRTFVPAIPDARQSERAIKQQARAWLVGLCDENTGELLDSAIHMTSAGSDGWLKVKAPHGDVRSYLLKRGVLVNKINGIALNRDLIGGVGDIDLALRDA